MKNLIEKKYRHLIFTNHQRLPSYEVIKFELFLRAHLGKDLSLIDPNLIQQIRLVIKSKCNGFEEALFFRNEGALHSISFSDLSFYQPDVGINGPKHTTIDTPIHVVAYNNLLILWNGYHRSLFKMITGEETALGYIIKIND